MENIKFAEARKGGKARVGINWIRTKSRKGVDRFVRTKRRRGQRTKGKGKGIGKVMLTRRPQPRSKKLLKAAAPQKKL